jgi:hypothetical protein
MTSEHERRDDDKPKARIAGRAAPLPRSRWLRTLLGVALIVAGILGFLPVLGFWMIPLGIAVLAYDWPPAARLRDRLSAWLRSRRR